jgi:hypothetical protein
VRDYRTNETARWEDQTSHGPKGHDVNKNDRPERAASAMTDGAVPASVSPRGLGKVQRGVWRCFIAFPAKDLTTADLVGFCYPRLEGKPGRPEWVAIRRAAEKVAVRVSRTHTRPGGIVWRAKPPATS